KTAIDTSIVVAALIPWHRDHERAFAALDAALVGSMVVLPSRTPSVPGETKLTKLPIFPGLRFPERTRLARRHRIRAGTDTYDILGGFS
ncbi:MAG: hypothetical protein K8R59_05805, partial [Thermoanaerobaculales bacterium]|nr:hypothetical protein [Thermoanaerobaculales bacterium]